MVASVERITLSRSSTSILEDPAMLRITLYAKRRPWVIAFLAGWFLLWLGAEAALLLPRLGLSMRWGVPMPDAPLAGVLFVAGFTVAGILVIARLLWGLLGREILFISPQILRVRRAVGPIGWTRDFPFADVHRLHLRSGSEPFGLPAWGRMFVGRGGNSIVFSYRGRTYRFARELDAAEATYLLNVIRQWTQND
jgi:hypothetical protein